MTLDELNEIRREADRLKSSASVMRDSEVSLAKLRREGKGFKEVFASLTNDEHRYVFGRRRLSVFVEVIEEHLPELLRVAELRLQAQARTAKQRERLLLDQIDGFLNGGDSGGDES